MSHPTSPARATSLFRRVLAAGASALLLIAPVACGDDDPTRPASEVAGTYTLRTANGDPLPAVVFEDELETLELLGGLIDLRADGTFEIEIDSRTIFADEETEETEIIEGTFTARGRQLTFRADDGTSLVASIDGAEITMSFRDFPVTGETLALVFRR